MDVATAVLLSAGWFLLAILLPGTGLAYLIGVRGNRAAGYIFAVIGLGTVWQPVLALALDLTVGISSTSLSLSLLGSTIAFVALGALRRRDLETVLKRVFRGTIRRLTDPSRSIPILVGAAAVGAIAAVNWSSAVQVHSVDIGWHIYWAQTIVATGHLPNYFQIEPFDQASKFTFGAHFILSEYQLLTGLPLTGFYWIPVLTYALAELVGLFAFTESLTGNRFLGFAVAAIIAGDSLAGGFIQRGNLPDILGYFVALFIFWLVAGIRDFDWRVVALGVALIAILEYHQLAAVITGLTLVVWIALQLAFRFHDSTQILRNIFLGRRQALFWAVALAGLALVARRTTYLNAGGVAVLTSSNWVSFIPSPSDYLTVIGLPLLLLGIAGMVICAAKRTQADLVLLAWMGALLFLADSPLFGLDFEPGRFMWRLPEALGLAAALGIFRMVRRVVPSTTWPGARERERPESGSAGGRRPSFQVPGIAIGIIVVVIIGFAWVGAIESAPRYDVPEPYLAQDAAIATWLRANGDPTKYVIVNVDADGSASWIMAESMFPHFLYKVDFGAAVSPPPYQTVYADLSALYGNPNSTAATTIVQTYRIGYVVADLPANAAFVGSPNFRLAYDAGGVLVFTPSA